MYKDKIIELCIFHIDEKDNRIENLQAVNDTYQGEIFKLEAENKRLKNGFGHGVLVELEQVDALKEQVSDLMIDKDRLIKQVSSIRDNSSSTHTHTQKEIDGYMHHNDINKAYIFVVDADAVDEDGFIADSHAVSTIQDSNCVSIV